MKPGQLYRRVRGTYLDPGLLAGRCKRPEYFIEGGPPSIPIVAEICVGQEVKMFTVKRMAHKCGA